MKKESNSLEVLGRVVWDTQLKDGSDLQKDLNKTEKTIATFSLRYLMQISYISQYAVGVP